MIMVESCLKEHFSAYDIDRLSFERGSENVSIGQDSDNEFKLSQSRVRILSLSKVCILMY